MKLQDYSIEELQNELRKRQDELYQMEHDQKPKYKVIAEGMNHYDLVTREEYFDTLSKAQNWMKSFSSAISSVIYKKNKKGWEIIQW